MSASLGEAEGADKQTPLAQLLAGDRTIPAGRVEAARSMVLADAAAVGGPPPDREAAS